MIKLQDIDLNLLLVFQLMYTERKTGLVADQLGITQPSVSNALARLRKTLNDELFERTARGMKPTPFADSIYDAVSYSLSMLHDGLNYEDQFNPPTSDRTFCLSMTDLGEMYLLPRLMAYLAEHAPYITLSTVRSNDLSLKEDMETGNVDLAIGLLPQLEAGFYQRRLFDQKYVCLMRQNHPLSKGSLTIERFSQAKHIIIEASGTGHGRVEKQLADSGVTRTIRLRLPHFVSTPYIISETDLVATVTEKLALQTQKSLNLIIRPHPINILPAKINIFWHRRYHQDAGNIWLRSVIFDMYSE